MSCRGKLRGRMRSITRISFLLVLTGVLLATGVFAAEPEPEYSWRILPHNIGLSDTVYLSLTRREGSNTMTHGVSVPLASLEGLERSDLWGGTVSFRIRRDAGTLLCKGSFLLGVGSGRVEFQPDPHFASDLRDAGLRDVRDDQLFELAIANLRISTARELHSACRCVETVDDVIELTNHGVDGHYLRQVARLLPATLTVEEIVQLKDHGVDLPLLDALRSGGYQLPVRSVIELHDHGVDGQFVRDLAPQFAAARDANDLIALHDHGVTAEFVRKLRESGATLTASQIIELHDHGAGADLVRSAREAGIAQADGSVSPVIALHDHGIDRQFVRDMGEALAKKLTTEELIRLHDQGVSPEFAKKVARSGFPDLTPDRLIKLHEHGVPVELMEQVARSHRVSFSTDEIVRLHEHGVDAGYLASFDAAGYSAASADEIIQLHEHGVTADYARRLQTEGFGTLTVNQLIKMKDHGV